MDGVLDGLNEELLAASLGLTYRPDADGAGDDD